MIIFDRKCKHCSIELNSENRNGRNDRCKECVSNINKKINAELKERTVEAYGGICSCCDEKHIEFLTIDHIFNDGSAERKLTGADGGVSFYKILENNGFPKDRYQLMCWNCNTGKRCNEHCPHVSGKIINLLDYKTSHNFKNKKGLDKI